MASPDYRLPAPHPPASQAALQQSNEEEAAFVRELLLAFPEIEPVYREHLDRQHELLAHMLMGDFTRWFIDRSRDVADLAESSADCRRLRALADFLDAAYQSGRYYVQELLIASFLENLWQAEGDYELVTSFLGPVLHAEIHKLE